MSIRLLNTWPSRLSWPSTKKALSRRAAAVAIVSVDLDLLVLPRLVSRDTRPASSSSFGDVDRARVLARQFGIEARGVGNVGDQAVEPAHVVLDHLDIRRLALFVGLGERQGLDGAAQRGQRVLQLVRDVGGEALDRLDAVVERVGHVAQRHRQMADLVLAVARNRGSPRALDAAAHPHGGAGQPAQRARRWCRRAASTGATVTSAATPKTRRIALRSARRSCRCRRLAVDSSSTPSTARKRWIGTATETIMLALLADAHDGRRAAVRARATTSG